MVFVQGARKPVGNSVSSVMFLHSGGGGADPWRVQTEPWRPADQVLQINRKHLRLVKKLGDAKFGLVSVVFLSYMWL